jgi:hypothetical protein
MGNTVDKRSDSSGKTATTYAPPVLLKNGMMDSGGTAMMMNTNI